MGFCGLELVSAVDGECSTNGANGGYQPDELEKADDDDEDDVGGLVEEGDKRHPYWKEKKDEDYQEKKQVPANIAVGCFEFCSVDASVWAVEGRGGFDATVWAVERRGGGCE